MSDPQQPTKEATTPGALDLAKRIQQRSTDSIGSGPLEFQLSAKHAAELIDRFAAQRVTRLSTAVEHWRQEVGKLHSLVDRRTKERDEATAATDKARREALEEAAQYAETFAKDNSAHVPQGKRIKGDLAEINMWMRAAVRTVASDIRALTPQNPGDAAPESEE